MPAPPSGEQFEIVHGEQRASIVEVGGGIRSYAHGARDVLEPYPLEKICDGAHGAVLVPWPNRLGDGSYEFDGQSHQLELNEPEKRNAIHGLLRWLPWRAVEREADRVVVAARDPPAAGLPVRPRGLGRVRALRRGPDGHPARPQRRRRQRARTARASTPTSRRGAARSTPAAWSCPRRS